MRLLLTRPVADSERLAARLRALGHETVIAPVLAIHIFDGPPLDLAGVQAILATSANGIRALARRTAVRDIAVFAVGPQTAETAREAGFAEIISANGDAAALAETVSTRLEPSKGKLFHAAGAGTAGRLRQRLEARGFTVISEILYEAQAIDALPAEAANALKDNTLDGVVMFSPRSARTFADLVIAAGLAARTGRLDAFCISAAAAAALAPLRFARFAVAGAPNETAVLGLIPAPGRVA